MHIVIVGPGALGGLLGATTSMGNDGSDSVSLLDYNHSRAEEINRNGLRYEKDGEHKCFNIKVIFKPTEIDHADILFLCVKSYDVEKCLHYCSPLLHSECLVIFMQNGIAHLDHDRHIGEAVAVYGTTTEGATCHGPGHIYHAGVGKTFLGFQHPPTLDSSHRLVRVIERLQAGGMNATTTESILNRIWAKLFINVGINALTVINNCKNGVLLELPEAQLQMRQAIEEAQCVAEVLHIKVNAHWRDTLEVCRATADNLSSMLQDVRKKRKTEIDAINGEVARLAASLGLQAPMNVELVRKVKDIEKQYA